MKKLLSILIPFFLLMFSFHRSAVYAQEVTIEDGGLSAPIIDMDNSTPDLFTGTMRYSIPILVPSGRKGIEPKLALTYRSTQQNDWLGVGWELEVGSIERSTKYGVDHNGDRYVLRMAGERKELVNTAVTSEYREYRAKVERQFLRI